jgi:hypothetical protein
MRLPEAIDLRGTMEEDELANARVESDLLADFLCLNGMALT